MSMIELLELVARMLARYRIIVALHLRSLESQTAVQLQSAIVKLFTIILEVLARAAKFFGRRTAGAYMKMKCLLSHMADHCSSPSYNRLFW